MSCSNCGTTENVAPRSWDLDLPTLVLCDICAYALVWEWEFFEELGRGDRRLGLAGVDPQHERFPGRDRQQQQHGEPGCDQHDD